MVSRRAAMARVGGIECIGGGPRLYRPGPISRGKLPWEWEWACPRVGAARWDPGGSFGLADVSEKGMTPALRAISCSPSCQCIASAARQGTCISSATLAHISGLNLSRRLAQMLVRATGNLIGCHQSQRKSDVACRAVRPRPRCLDLSYLSYSLASLFFRSSSHSLLRSR